MSLFIADSKVVTKVIPAHPTVVFSRKGVKPRIIVLHSAETSEITASAEGTAGYFMGGSGGRIASAHYCTDIDSVVQCIPEDKSAAGTPGGWNRFSIHIEQAGRAAQSVVQWRDAYSTEMIDKRVVPLLVDICLRHHIVPKFVTLADALSKITDPEFTGITTHAVNTDYCIVKKLKTNRHYDPGGNYPKDAVIKAVQAQIPQKLWESWLP
jgi:hypothetical protein